METKEFGPVKYSTTSYSDKNVTIELEGITWKLMSDNERLHSGVLTIYLECDYVHKKSTMWSVDAEIELQVTSEVDFAVTKKMDHRFERILNKADFGVIVSLDDLVTANDEHICLGCADLKFTVNIRFKSIVGIQENRFANFSTPQNSDSEVLLRVGEHHLYVDKYALICVSSEFSRMLSDNDEMEIQDIEVEHFVSFLRLLYGQKQQIESKNLEHLLKLAKLYDVQFLLSDFEDLLRTSEQFTIVDKLHYSEISGFSRLQEEILDNITKEDFKQFPEMLRELGLSTSQALLEKLSEIEKHDEWLDMMWTGQRSGFYVDPRLELHYLPLEQQMVASQSLQLKLFKNFPPLQGLARIPPPPLHMPLPFPYMPQFQQMEQGPPPLPVNNQQFPGMRQDVNALLQNPQHFQFMNFPRM